MDAATARGAGGIQPFHARSDALFNSGERPIPVPAFSDLAEGARHHPPLQRLRARVDPRGAVGHRRGAQGSSDREKPGDPWRRIRELYRQLTQEAKNAGTGREPYQTPRRFRLMDLGEGTGRGRGLQGGAPPLGMPVEECPPPVGGAGCPPGSASGPKKRLISLARGTRRYWAHGREKVVLRATIGV